MTKIIVTEMPQTAEDCPYVVPYLVIDVDEAVNSLTIPYQPDSQKL